MTVGRQVEGSRFSWLAIISVALLGLGSCARTNQVEEESPGVFVEQAVDWQSPLYQDHPLAGTIWQVNEGRFVSVDELARALSASHFLMLGEKHDNPDHHRLQLDILRFLLNRRQVASVSFEMMDSDFDSRLASLDPSLSGSLDQLKAYLQWDEEGWNWSFYGPLIAETLAAGVPVKSANISSARVGEVYSQPLDPAVASVLDARAIEQLNAEIDESHCNMLPPSQFPAMVRVQQARDNQMATSLAAADQQDWQAILFAGNYHVRRDLGVPNYLLALRPDIAPEAVLSLALLEVDPESADPADYLQAYSAVQPFDYVWFTPAISEEDYCAGFTR